MKRDVQWGQVALCAFMLIGYLLPTGARAAVFPATEEYDVFEKRAEPAADEPAAAEAVHEDEPVVSPGEGQAPHFQYLVGPGDGLTIFVWGNPDLSTSVTVRPDGMISVPLVEDLKVTGRTPSQVARDIEVMLGKFVKSPLVTVIMGGFVGTYEQQIRVVGEAAKPQTLSYRDKMTLLDLMIAVGGLTDYAAGNRAKIIRVVDGKQQAVSVRLNDLLRDGDIAANIQVMPGDILIIPESWF